MFIYQNCGIVSNIYGSKEMQQYSDTHTGTAQFTPKRSAIIKRKKSNLIKKHK